MPLYMPFNGFSKMCFQGRKMRGGKKRGPRLRCGQEECLPSMTKDTMSSPYDYSHHQCLLCQSFSFPSLYPLFHDPFLFYFHFHPLSSLFTLNLHCGYGLHPFFHSPIPSVPLWFSLPFSSPHPSLSPYPAWDPWPQCQCCQTITAQANITSEP